MSSSGVQMVGNSNPRILTTTRAARWISALAMCRQFQVSRYSHAYAAAIAMWRASPTALRGNRSFRYQSLRQFQYPAGEGQNGKVRHELQPLLGERGVSGGGFLQYQFRNIQIEVGTARFPPIARNLLVGCDQQITAELSRAAR